MKTKTYIYALQDPNTNEVRYIGKSNNPQSRFKNHIGDGVNARKRQWILSLRESNQRPNLIILEEVDNEKEVYKAAENSWIRFFLACGNNLLNWIYKGYDREEMLNQ